MKRSTQLKLWAAVSLCALPTLASAAESFDLVIYGGTAGGVTAAIQAARMGRSVVLIEPTQHLGGMTTNGLSATDTGNTGSIQGIAREFYTRVGQSYGLSTPEWNFEPKVAESVLNTWVGQTSGLTVVRGERLDLLGGVTKTGNRISSIRMESGRVFEGSMFIDAGYEGDLMAKAGVSYTFGRESNAQYGETYNGIQTARATKHQFSAPVDPYVIPGNPASGLLKGVSPQPPGIDGQADNRIQAYNYRLTLTKAADRRTWTAPADYDPSRYELLKRHIQANNTTSLGSLLSIRSLKNGKYDVNNNGAVSTDNIGANYEYPDGDYATRDEIAQDHRSYQQGLFYFLATDPSVPSTLRTQMNSYGLTNDEFTDNEGWSGQMYIREARRMVGPYVMTDKNVMSKREVEDSVALASYTMDSHNTQRYIDATGHARNEGDIQIGVPSPFSISYRSITPFESEASNLLVTTALSTSHIAYGSIRMEPVFMELGQAAATAASLSLEQNTSVQDLSYTDLRRRLIADGALLEWPANMERFVGIVRADFNDYATLPQGLRYQAGGTGFLGNWDGTGTENIVAGDLTTTQGGYAITQSGPGQKGKLKGNYSVVRQNQRALEGKMSGDIWFSFLAENPDATAAAGVTFNSTGNADPANDTLRNYIELRGNNLRVTIDGLTTDSGIATLSVGETHLILGRIITSDGVDIFQLWADPDDLTNLGQPDFISTDKDWLLSLTKIAILSYNPTGPNFGANGGTIDSLILSNQPSAFFDVTGVPEPSTLALLALTSTTLLARRRR